jgi:hypothetical protein
MKQFSSIVGLASALVVLSVGAGVSEPRSTEQAGPTKAASPYAIAGTNALYRVTNICSVNSGTNHCTTAVRISNQAGAPCKVGVEFFAGATTSPSCTVTATISPGTRQNFCSRNFATPESCSVICNPELTLISGYAIVYGHCNRITVEADVFTIDSADSAITSARSSNIVYIGADTGPGVNANRGD